MIFHNETKKVNSDIKLNFMFTLFFNCLSMFFFMMMFFLCLFLIHD